MKKKIFAWALALMLVLQYFNYTGVLRQAEAAPGIDEVGFPSAELRTGGDYNVSGAVIASINGTTPSVPDPDFEIDLSKTLVLEYTWKLEEGHQFINGNKSYTFALPDGFRLQTTQTKDLEGSPNNFGTFTANHVNNTITMNFNEHVEVFGEGAAVDGTMWIWVYVDESKVENNEINIEFIPGTTPVTLKIEAPVVEPVEYEVTKSGRALPSFNPTEIEWTIVANASGESITNAVVRDTINVAGGLALPSTSEVVVQQLDGNGAPTGVGLPAGGSVTLESNTLVVNLGDINNAYRIIFKTGITNNSVTSFTNTAELSGQEISTPVTATAPAVTPVRGLTLNKASTNYSAATETVDWRIKFNFGLQSLTDPVVLDDYFGNDTFGAFHELIPGSIKVHRVNTLNSNDNYTLDSEDLFGSEWTLGTVSSVANREGFRLSHAGNTSDAYVITYQTRKKADVRIYDNTSVSNKVSFGSEETSTSRTITQRFLSKDRVGNVNYAEKTVSWQVNINNSGYNIREAEYTDTFGDGLILKPGTLRVNNAIMAEGANGDIDVAFSKDTNNNVTGFTVQFPDGTSSYRITYDTYYDHDAHSYETLLPSYVNNGVLTWHDDVTVEKQTKTTEAVSEDLNAPSQLNGLKTGSYNAVNKKITWGLLVNYDSKSMTNATVTDPITSIQQLDLSSIVIHETSIRPDGSMSPLNDDSKLAEGTDYTVDFENDVLTIVFNGTITSPRYIQFETSLANKIIDTDAATIANSAEFKADEFDPKTLSANVPIEHAGEFIAKTGNHVNGTYEMNWSIVINMSQSHIRNVTIVDTPSENQILMTSSFKLFKAEVDSETGNIASREEIDWRQENDGVNISFNEDGTFTLTFDEISKPYVLEYTSILDVEGTSGTVQATNSVAFEGFGESGSGSVDTTEDSQSQSISINLQNAGGTGSKPKGFFRVIKVDAENNQPLEGVQFRLERNNINVFPDNPLVTDENGIIEIPAGTPYSAEGLPYGKYQLIEEQAPNGYELLSDPFLIQISEALVEYTVTNERQTGDLEVVKVEQGNPSKLLPGAEFILYNSDKSAEIGRLTTGTDEADAATFGKAILDDLPFGTYVLKEVKAPAGYTIIGNGEQTIEIKPNEKTTVTVENRKFTYIPPIIILPTPTPEPSEEPGETQEPGETNEPGETTSPTPTPTPGPSTTPAPTESAKPTTPPQKEKTTEETPVDGEVEVPEDSEPKIGTPPSNGNVTITPDGKWTYVPNPGFVGTDRFSIVIVNENGEEEEEVWVDVEVDHVPRGGTDLTPDVDKLPKTGENSSLPLYLLGIALIGGGIALRFVKRNKKA
jgi:Predicted outer membrane protein